MIDGAGTLTAYDGVGNTNALTDTAIRRAIQYLDDGDVPMEGRVFLFNPAQRNTLNGIARYTEQAFVGEVGGGNTIRNGEVGNLYGVPVVITTNVPTSDGSNKACFLLHEDAFVIAEQMGLRTQTQYKLEFLGDLVVMDMLYGTQVLRPENGVVINLQ